MKFKEDQTSEIIEDIFEEINVRPKKPIGPRDSVSYVNLLDNDESRVDKAEEFIKVAKEKEGVEVEQNGMFYNSPAVKTTVDRTIDVRFKPNLSKILNHESIAAMELFWAYCISCYFAGIDVWKDNPEHVIADAIPECLQNRITVAPSEGALEGYLNGPKKLEEFLLNTLHTGTVDYCVCRENITFYEGDIIDEDKKYSIHSLTTAAVKKKMAASFQKDTWNPSDIMLVKKSEYERIRNEWEALSKLPSEKLYNRANLESLNEVLRRELLAGNLIGVSLKSPAGSVGITAHNMRQPDKVSKSPVAPPTYKLILDKLPSINGDLAIEGRVVEKSSIDDSSKVYYFEYRRFGGNICYMEMAETEKSAMGKFPSELLDELYLKYNIGRGYHREKWNMLPNIEGYFNIETLLSSYKDINFQNLVSGKEPLSLPTYNEIANLFVRAQEKLSSADFNTRSYRNYFEVMSWPQLLDFLALISKPEEDMQRILKTFVEGSAKVFETCAPFLLMK